MLRSGFALALGLALFFTASNSRADEIKRALFVLGIHMEQAEGVATEMIGESLKEKPGSVALVIRGLNNAIDVASVLKLPTEGMKTLLADVEAGRASFADIATRMAKMRLDMAATASKSINPGAGAFYIMGHHQSQAERLATGVVAFQREDKPGTNGLIERQLARMADATGGLMLTAKPVLDIQKKMGTPASFAEIAKDLGALRLAWDKELGAQPGFGGAVAGGKVILSTSGKLASTDPRDRLNKTKFARIHTIRVKAGQTVIIDLESGDGDPNTKPGFFDTYLRLEDMNNKVLGENDDVVSGKNYNSRIEFTAKEEGDYRIVVTSFRSEATGPYTLVVRTK